MSLIATERFSDRRLRQKIDGNWVAVRGWDVIGYSDPNDACAATGVLPGDSHPRNTELKCVSIHAEDDKLTLCRVVATYEITSLLNNPENPLLRKPIVSWKQGKVSEPIDLDMMGNPILNSAGDAFKNAFHRNFSVRFLTITRFEPYYDQSTAQNFTDTVNSGTISFEGNSFDAGQVYCLSYAPTESYQKGSTYVQTAYQFEIRTPNAPNLTKLQKRHPFQLRILDQGLRGVYADAGNGGMQTLAPLYLSSGEPVTRDVLLIGNGTPADTTITVSNGFVAPAPQTLPKTVFTDQVTIDYGNNRKIKSTFLIYMIYPEVDFTQLGVNASGGEA